MDVTKTPSLRDLFPPEPTRREPAWKRVVVALRRQKRAAALCLGAAILIGLAYLIFTPALHETTCSLRVEAADLSQPAMEATASSLLSAQAEIMRSRPVIVLAIASPQTRGLSLLQNKENRVEFIQSNLAIHPAGQSGVYELTFTSSKPDDAEKLLDSLAAAYIQYQASPHGADPVRAALDEQRQKINDDLVAATRQLNDVLKLPRKASPTPQARQKLALERAELAAALARAGHAPNAADPMQQRLNALDRQAQDNDALDDEIARLQGEVERLTALDNELRQRMRGGSSSPESSVAISLVRQPESDSATVWPKPWPILGVSVLAGLLLGVVAATAMDLTSVCLQDADDAAIWGQTQVIGHVPAMSQDLHSPPLRGQCVAVSPNHPSAQACRSVRAKVESVMVEGIDKTILITGPGNFQGKSVLASNLAIAMARAGRRVALVDAHHHNPAINGIFAIDDSVGLDGAIEGRFKISDVLHVTELSGLEVLPTGSSDADWSELLNHPRFLAALTELSERFDRVIIDGGPALMDECRIISAFCDATILAVDARRCRRRDLRAAAEGLRAVGAKLAGIVLIDLPVPAAVVKTPVPAPAPRRAAIRGRAQADAPAGMAETA